MGIWKFFEKEYNVLYDFISNKQNMKKQKTRLIKFLIYGLATCLFKQDSLALPAHKEKTSQLSKPKKEKKSVFNSMSPGDLMRFFLRCMKLIQSSYIDDISNATLIEGAIQGMLNATDPHSTYFNDSEYHRLQEHCKGSFGGVGIVMTSDRSGMRVISCLDDTPAAKAGILPGDIIVAIDDKLISTSEGFSGVSEMMRGKPGTMVKLSIERKGQSKIIHLNIKRAVISVKSVKHQMNNDIAVIRIANFDEQTADLLKKALQEVQAQTKDALRGYIIDLRRNPGGLVESAVNCCQLFIDRGVLLRSKGRNGADEEIKYAIPGLSIVKNKPIVVLIDEGSASASEMMAGALQDHKVALVLGVTSFGKGSTQAVIPLDSKTGAIKLTAMRWYTPITQTPIQGRGITPDIVVEQVKAIEPLDSEDLVVREGNFSRALASEPEKVDKESASLEKKPNSSIGDHESSKKGSTRDTPAVPGDGKTKGDKDKEKNKENSSKDMDEERGFDYQMLRAMDVINALHVFQNMRNVKK